MFSHVKENPMFSHVLEAVMFANMRLKLNIPIYVKRIKIVFIRLLH